MIDEDFYPLAGLVLVVWGGAVTVKRDYFSSKHQFIVDWGEYHYVIGIAMILYGVILLFNGIRKRRSRDE